MIKPVMFSPYANRNIAFKGNCCSNTCFEGTKPKTKGASKIQPSQKQFGIIVPSSNGKHLNAYAFDNLIAMSSGNSDVGKQNIYDWFERHGVQDNNIIYAGRDRMKSSDASHKKADKEDTETQSSIVTEDTLDAPALEDIIFIDEYSEPTIEKSKGGNHIILRQGNNVATVRIRDGYTTLEGEDGLIYQGRHVSKERLKELELACELMDSKIHA